MLDPITVPVVLTIAGHDPSGGAGIQADIEAITSMGCHATSAITTLTIQDTVDLQRHEPVAATLLVEQIRAVLEDMPIAAIKLGLLGSIENIEVLHTILMDYPDLPVVLDPILRSGGGTDLANQEYMDAISNLLIPNVTILTPNTAELQRLAPEGDNIDACAHEILDTGCEFVLVTGTDHFDPKKSNEQQDVINTLYGNNQKLDSYRWQRLPYSYHGSGCTLASALAGLIAQGMEPMSAVYEAQHYTWETLRHGYRIGMGQYIPNRLFWAQEQETSSEGESDHEE